MADFLRHNPVTESTIERVAAQEKKTVLWSHCMLTSILEHSPRADPSITIPILIYSLRRAFGENYNLDIVFCVLYFQTQSRPNSQP